MLYAPAQTKFLMLLTACEKDVKIARKMLVTHPIKGTTVKNATFGFHRNFGRSHSKGFTFTTYSLRASITPGHSILNLDSSLQEM